MCDMTLTKVLINSSLLIILALTFNTSSAFPVPTVSSDPDEIKFFLYTNNSGIITEKELSYQDIESISSSGFNSKLPTVIMIHGFWSNRRSNFPSKLVKAYMESQPSTKNYIVVDWGTLSQLSSSYLEDIISPIIYPYVVRKNIPIVSQRVATFLKVLIVNRFATLDKLHIIGHSLGAHISGFVGNLLQNNALNQKVGRITGLDPAGPLFDQGIKIQRNLVRNDGQFVDVYHTAMGTKGDSTIDGDVDFYPNGGVLQPLCKDETEDVFSRGSCSHEYVVDIFAATLINDYQACQCHPQMEYNELINCLTDCPNPIVPGERCPSNAEGLYYFGTPF